MNAISHQVGLGVIDNVGFESAGAGTFVQSPFLRSKEYLDRRCYLPLVLEFKCSDDRIEKCAMSGIYKLVYPTIVLMGPLILVAPHSISRDSRPVSSYSTANILRILTNPFVHQVCIAQYSLHEKVVYSAFTSRQNSSRNYQRSGGSILALLALELERY